MGANALNAVTGLDVLLLLAAILLGFALHRAATSIDDRLVRTGSVPRIIWMAIGIVLLGVGLWTLSLTAAIPFRHQGTIGLAVLPAFLSAAICLVGSAVAWVNLDLHWSRAARVTVGALLWGSAVAATHFLTLDGLGWRSAVLSRPIFSAQVFLVILAGAAIILWGMEARREGSPHQRWSDITAATVASLAGPAAVYSAFIITSGGFHPIGSSRPRLHYLIDPHVVLVSACFLAVSAGLVVAAAGVDRRLLARREETEALRRSEDRFRSLIQASSQIVWTTNPDGEMRGEQTSWSTFTGQDASAYRGWGWFNAIHPEDRESTASVWQSSLANRTPVELQHRVRRYDGQYRDCVARVVPVLEADGRVREWVGTHADVTDRARLQEERDLLANAGRVLSSSLDEQETVSAIATLVVPGLADWCAIDIRSSNGAIDRFVATRNEPIRAISLDSAVAGARFNESGGGIGRVLATGESEMYREVDEAILGSITANDEDSDRLRQDGITSVITVPLVARRQVLGTLTLASTREKERYDLRDLALAEELARRSAIAIDNARLYSASRSAIQARDEMVSIVSHDLRNPLSTIMMTSDLLLEVTPSVEEQRRHFHAIGRAAASMNRLIRDLLDAGLAETGRLAIERDVVAPDRLAVEVCETMLPIAAERNQRLSCDTDPALSEILADPARLEQVLSNLLGNAIKFVQQGGTIHLQVLREDGRVRFTVEDNGPGIPPEDLPHIFERHWRGKHNAHLGTGLGLSIARAIVEAHGGQIWVESDRGRGTAFHFTIPMQAPAHGVDAGAAAQTSAPSPPGDDGEPGPETEFADAVGQQ